MKKLLIILVVGLALTSKAGADKEPPTQSAESKPKPTVLWQASALAKPQFQPVAEPETKLHWSSKAEPAPIVTAINYSPDGNILASGHQEAVKLWNTRTGELILTLRGHTSEVLSVAFTPDGETLASGGGEDDKTIKLWDVRSGKFLRTLVGHDHWIRSMVFAPDGNTLVSASADNSVKIWDVRSGKLVSSIDGHSDEVDSVALAPDGQTIASGSSDTTAKIWDANSGELLLTLEGHTSGINSVVFAPENNVLATGSYDDTIKIWSVRNGELLQTLEGHTKGVQSLRFVPDGEILISSSLDSTIKSWDVRSGELMLDLAYAAKSLSLSSAAFVHSFSPNGDMLALGDMQGKIKIRDTHSGELKLSIDARDPDRHLKGHAHGVASAALANNGEILASGGMSDIKIWNARNGDLLRTLEGQESMVTSLALSADNDTLASASALDVGTGTRIWSARSGKLLRTLEEPDSLISSIAFAHDGSTLATAFININENSSIKLWDVRSGKVLHTLKDLKGGVRSIAFAPNGQILASSAMDDNYAIKLWDVHSGELLLTLQGYRSPEGHTSTVRTIVFADDGSMLASGSSIGTIKLWDSDSGKLLHTLHWHDPNSSWMDRRLVHSVSFSPDGKTLASGGSDGVVNIWDVHSGKLLQTLEGNDDGISQVIFAPDGQTLISTGNTIKFWHVPARERAWNIFVADYESNKAGLPELQQLRSIYPQFQDKYNQLAEYVDIQQLIAQTQIKQPKSATATYAAIQAYVDARLQAYLAADYEIAAVEVPQRSAYPPRPQIIKDEYEKTAAFQLRAQTAEADYRAEVARIDAEYERATDKYNVDIQLYNSELAIAQEARATQLPAKRLELIGEAMALAYGAPQITKTVYDADNEIFHAELVGEQGGFTEKIKIPVPIEQARALGENNQEAIVEAVFVEDEDGALNLYNVRVVFRKQDYRGELSR